MVAGAIVDVPDAIRRVSELFLWPPAVIDNPANLALVMIGFAAISVGLFWNALAKRFSGAFHSRKKKLSGQPPENSSETPHVVGQGTEDVEEYEEDQETRAAKHEIATFVRTALAES